LEYGLPLSEADRIFLDDMRRRYRIAEELDDAGALPLLRKRMDTLPESLVLAQAAIESGWGRSRFAREANNLFGQWCFEAGCGLVPQRRLAGASHEVASFETVDAAIASYFRNLNSHPVYAPVRDIRARARAADTDLSGLDLAAGLSRYSERGEAYIEEVRQVIRVNALEPARG
jgi:Bax protein